MNFKFLKNKSPFNKLGNSYLIILIVFVIWMLFLDENSYLIHRELNKEIEELETWIEYHKQKIAKDRETIKNLKDSVALERYAREKYLMKKANEDLYIIVFDTLNKK
ncbi:MAG: FtsB family cell division protein [Tenacibaculum sp.]